MAFINFPIKPGFETLSRGLISWQASSFVSISEPILVEAIDEETQTGDKRLLKILSPIPDSSLSSEKYSCLLFFWVIGNEIGLRKARKMIPSLLPASSEFDELLKKNRSKNMRRQ